MNTFFASLTTIIVALFKKLQWVLFERASKPRNRNTCKVAACMLMVCLFLTNKGLAQFSNITINSAGPTSGGTWNGAAPWVFTPNAATATILNTDIQTKLANGNITILGNTVVGGVNPGSIIVSNAIIASNTSATANTLAFTSATSGSIAINAPINISGANGTGTAGAAGGAGHNLTFTGGTNASASVLFAAPLSTFGGIGAVNSGGIGGIGRKGGNITVTCGGAFIVSTSSTCDARGGAGGNGSSNGGAGGSGGTIAFGIAGTPISGAVSVASDIYASGGAGGNAGNGNNSGGAGANGANVSIVSSSAVSMMAAYANGGNSGVAKGTNGLVGGQGGVVTITSGTATTVNIGGKVSAIGGNGSVVLAANANGGNGGAGNTVIITGPGGISVGNGDSLITYGGSGGGGMNSTSGNGGAGASVQLISSATVTIGTSSGINTSGGKGADGASSTKGGNGGAGGQIIIGNGTPIGGAINIASSLNSSGGIAGNATASNNAGGAGGLGANITVISSSTVSVGTITTNGGSSGSSYGATGSIGGNAGTITVTSGSGANISIGGKLAANGGNGSNGLATNSNGTTGGSGNAITITGPGGIGIGNADSLTAYGGAGGIGTGGTGGAGGIGGPITLASANGNITVGTSSGIIASGGNGGATTTANAAGAGGAGGTISIGNLTPIAGSINISSAINASGGIGGNAGTNNNSGGGGGAGAAVNIVATGTVNTLAVIANGGNSGNSYGNPGIVGGNAGAVKITSGAGTILSVGGKIAANGGNGGNVLTGNGAGGNGGAANTITITGPGGISIGNSDSLTAYGGYGGTGNGGNGGSGSGGGVITLVSSAGAVVIGTSSGISTAGGNGGSSTGTRGNGGNAAAINITGFAGITMPSNLIATGGTLGASGTAGTTGTAASISINDGNVAVTTGGSNDGISGIITGLKFNKSGSGTLNIAGANTYTDSTSLYGGRLELSVSDRVPNVSDMGFYGGGISTGATTGYNETADSIKLTDNSNINFGAGGHSLNFSASNTISWTAGKILTITNWNGPYDGTTAGPANGKLFIGSNASGLTTTQLAQIKFLRPSNGLLYDALILSTGEIVAYDPALVYINVLSITYPSCTGNSGSITVGGFGGVAPYTFNINSGLYQTSGTFSGLGAGTYILGVKDNNGQTKTTSVQLDVLVITSDTGTCAGGSVQLQASTAGAYSYSWSPATGLSNANIANPVANPAGSTIYTATAVIIDNTVNLISNPGFESGNTGFSSSYIYHICGPYASSWSPAPAAPCDMYGQFHNGIYKVRKNATDLCTNLTNFNARTGDSMLVVDGPNSGTYVTAPFWSQTVSGLALNTNYVFTFWVRQAFNGAGAYAVVRTDINGTAATGTATYPNPYTASSSVWTQISYFWNSGASSTANITMYDQTIADAANDFAIDDMSFYITCNASKNVTVSITVPPTLSTVAQPVQVCAGSAASINITGLTAVDTFTVNYTINGISQVPLTGIISDGSGNASFTSAALTVLNNGQILQVTSLTNTGGHSNCTQTFTGKTVTLAVNATGTWLGSTNTDWNTASNWCGGVPTASTDVVIPDYGTGGVYPIVAPLTAGACKNIIISDNASVTININGSLAVGGTYNSNGTLTNNGELIFNSGSIAQIFPGLTGTVSSMNNLTINNTSGLGVTFDRNFSIYGAFTPTTGNVNLSNNVYVTLTSTNSTTARVGVVGSSVLSYTGTGKFVVERYYPGRRKWRLITAPVVVDGTKTIFNSWQVGGNNSLTGSGTYVSGSVAPSFGLDVSPLNNSSLKTFDYVTSGFNPVLNTLTPLISGLQTGNTSSLSNLAGYFMFVRGDRTPANVDAFNASGTVVETTLRDTGTLKTGTYNFTCNPASGGNIYTLIGNPYASPVDFSTLTRSNVANKFWAWDPNLGGTNGVGGYVILDASPGPAYGFTKVPTTSTGTISQTLDIQSSQAFLVETTGPSPSITFNEGNKSANDNRGLFRPVANTIQLATLAANIYLREDDGSREIVDGVVTQFNRGFSSTTDELDAAKFTNVNETFSIASNNTYLSLERRPLLTEKDTLFYSLARTKNRNYTFNVYVQHFTQKNLAAFLEDSYLKKLTRVNMNGDTWVNFDINADPASKDKTRFRIVFRKLNHITSVHATVVNNDIVVDWNIESGYGHEYYEIQRSLDGTTFELAGLHGNKGISETGAFSWLDIKPVPGIYYYRIKCISNEGLFYSEIVKVMITKAGPSVYIFPNPVVGNRINLQMRMMPAGKYTVVLIDNSGREVLRNRINHLADNTVENIDMKSVSSTGAYHLKVSGPENYEQILKILYK